MKHSEHIEIVKSYGALALKNVMIKWVVKTLPIFASGPFNYVLVKLATKFGKEAAEEGEMRVFFVYVDFRTDSQAKDFEAAMLKNHATQNNGSNEDKTNAEKELVTALNSLVHLSK